MSRYFENTDLAATSLPKTEAESIAMSINILFGNAKMFSPSHPSTENAATELCKKISSVNCGNSLLTFIKSGKSFYMEKWLVDNKISHSRFMQDFERLQIESISFMNGISVKSVMNFIEIFIYALENKLTADKIQDILTRKNEKGIVLNYITFQKVSKGDKVVGADEIVIKESDYTDSFAVTQTIPQTTQTPKNAISHLEKLFNLRTAIEGDSFSQIRDFDFVNNELTSIKYKIKEQNNSGEIDYDSLFNSLVDVSKIVKSAEFLFKDQKDGEKEKVISEIDKMTINAILEIIKSEIKQNKFSVKKLVLVIKRLDPSKEVFHLLLPQIKNAMLEVGLNVSDYLDFVMELGNKFSEEKAVEKIFDKADDFGVKPAELVEAFSQNPQECVKLLLQSAEIQKQHFFDTNLSDYLAKMLDSISRDVALQKIRLQKIGGDVHSVISSVISSVNSGLIEKLKENGVQFDTANQIQKELMEKFPKTLEHLKNEWLVNTLGNAESLTQDAIVKMLTKVASTGSGEDTDIYKKSLLHFSEKFNLSATEIAEILGTVSRQRKLLEQKKDLPILPPKTTIHFTKHYIEEYKRHKNPFSIMMISEKNANTTETTLTIAESLALSFAKIFRTLDLFGYLKIRDKDFAVIILPMTGKNGLETVLKKTENTIDSEKHILTSISYESPDEYDNYETMMKKLLLEHL